MYSISMSWTVKLDQNINVENLHRDGEKKVKLKTHGGTGGNNIGKRRISPRLWDALPVRRLVPVCFVARHLNGDGGLHCTRALTLQLR
jgi:hypothetical protein